MSPVFILWFAVGGTLYNGPYGDALPKRTSRLQEFQVYETVGISLSIWKGREICNFGLSKGPEGLSMKQSINCSNNLSFLYLSLFQLSLECCKVSLLLLSNSSKCSLREIIYNQNLSYVSINFAIFLITTAWLVQLGERRYAEREVAGSNLDRTNTEGL